MMEQRGGCEILSGPERGVSKSATDFRPITLQYADELTLDFGSAHLSCATL
jgi:hypothetical protein